ncbi:hypothetical protein Tco_0598079 [Tanacetum coccineum]
MREGTIKPRHQDLEWFGYKALLRPTPLPTQDFTMSTSSLQAEKTVYTSLTLFSDTKLNVEVEEYSDLMEEMYGEDCTCHPCVGDRKIRERVENLKDQLDEQKKVAQEREQVAKALQQAAEERERACEEWERAAEQQVKGLEKQVKDIVNMLKTLKPLPSPPPS